MKNWLIKSNDWFDSLKGLKELYKLLLVMSFNIPLFFGHFLIFGILVLSFVFWRLTPFFIGLYDISKEQSNNTMESLVIEKLGQLERGELDNNFSAKELALKMKNEPKYVEIYEKWKRRNNE